MIFLSRTKILLFRNSEYIIVVMLIGSKLGVILRYILKKKKRKINSPLILNLWRFVIIFALITLFDIVFSNNFEIPRIIIANVIRNVLNRTLRVQILAISLSLIAFLVSALIPFAGLIISSSLIVAAYNFPTEVSLFHNLNMHRQSVNVLSPNFPKLERVDKVRISTDTDVQASKSLSKSEKTGEVIKVEALGEEDTQSIRIPKRKVMKWKKRNRKVNTLRDLVSDKDLKNYDLNNTDNFNITKEVIRESKIKK